MNILKEFDQSRPVKIYRNLTKQCFSIVQKGLVVAYTEAATLRDCQFIVQPAGSEKVKKTGHKNVHAYIKGTLVENVEWLGYARRVTYNPHTHHTFVDTMTWNPVFFAKEVVINNKWVLYLP